MAVKKPIALYNGKLKELQTGDTLVTSTSGTYNDMLAISSPFSGMSFMVTDYMPGHYIYDGYISEWTLLPRIQDVAFMQNFSIVPSTTTWAYFVRNVLGTGSAATIVIETGGLTKFGSYLDLITGTTTTGFSAIVSANAYYIGYGATKKAAFFHRLRVPVLSTGSEEFVIGIGNGYSSASIPLLGLFYNRLNFGANWQAISSTFNNVVPFANGTTTITNTGIAVNTNYNEFVVLFDAGNVKFYINGALVATHTTNIPTNVLYSGVLCRKQAGTTSVSLHIDHALGLVFKR